METMWEFSLGRFAVRAGIEPANDLDLSWDDTGEVHANLESGLWQAFVAKVGVYLNGAEIGADYLGGCIYENPSDFFIEHRNPDPMARNCSEMREARGDVVIAHYFPCMVRNAIAEARKWMRDAGCSCRGGVRNRKQLKATESN